MKQKSIEYLWEYGLFSNYVGHCEMFEIEGNVTTIYSNIILGPFQ